MPAYKVEKADNSSMQTKTDSLSEADIFHDYKDVFEGLGCLSGILHLDIDETIQPTQQLPRKVPLALKDELKQEIDSLTKRGILKKVDTPSNWISSMVVVKKPGKMRICIDPKDLNCALKRSHYNMPTIEDILPKLSKARVFSVLDAKEGYWQIKLDEESSYLTTFWTPFGRYRWLRMPFGIAPAPEEFQRRQHMVLEGLDGVDSIFDDILVFGCGDDDQEAIEDHDRKLIKLLDRAREKNLKLNKKKLCLRKKSVRYMGHILTAEGLKPDPEKIRAITEMQAPTTVKEVQRFVGFVTYLSKFLPHLSEKCEPLRRLTLKDVPWHWESMQQRAFEEIKCLVTQAPVLHYYNVSEEVTVQCDASSVGLGATLMQNGQPVAFASRALTPTEQNYAQIEKECLAIVFSCDRFYQYLCGKDTVTVETDHKPLETIFKKSVLSAPKRLQRMLLRLQRYNLEVCYKKGSQMYIADLLSRSFLKETTETKNLNFDVYTIRNHYQFCKSIENLDWKTQLNVTAERLQQIQTETSKDKLLKGLQQLIREGWPSERKDVPTNLQVLWQFREDLVLQDGIIFKGSKVLIPETMRAEMLSRIHAHHMGIESCTRKARDVLFWPGMGKDISEFISRCYICNEFSDKQVKQPLKPHEISELPWQTVALDLFTLHNKNYLVITDYFSSFWEIDELVNTTAETVIECCKRHFSCHGIPTKVVSDGGPQFTGSEFREFSTAWEFNHVTTSPYHSQSNGKAESGVKIAKRLLKKIKAARGDIWKAILEWRNTPTEGMDSSPNQRLMSRRTRTLLPTTRSLLEPRVEMNIVKKLKMKQDKAKYYYDRHTKELSKLESGDVVRVQPTPQSRDKRWRLGKCIREVYPRSYIVDVDGTEYRRNRRFLRKTNEPGPIEDDLPIETIEREPLTHEVLDKEIGVAGPHEENNKQTVTRSGRIVRRPLKYNDFIV